MIIKKMPFDPVSLQEYSFNIIDHPQTLQIAELAKKKNIWLTYKGDGSCQDGDLPA